MTLNTSHITDDAYKIYRAIKFSSLVKNGHCNIKFMTIYSGIVYSSYSGIPFTESEPNSYYELEFHNLDDLNEIIDIILNKSKG